MNKLALVAGTCSIVSLAAGAGAGYLYAQKQLEKKYSDLAAKEIAEARDYYRVIHKKGQFETPQSAAEALLPTEREALNAMVQYQGRIETTDDGIEIERGGFVATGPFDEGVEDNPPGDDPAEVLVKSVFDEVDVDIAAEIRDRTEDFPYIISAEEFFANDAEHEQLQLTYFAGDGILMNDKEGVIPNIDDIVGDYNIPRFGHRSNDKNLLYVRNHVLGEDFEISLSKGKYGEEVAGFRGDDD